MEQGASYGVPCSLFQTSILVGITRVMKLKKQGSHTETPIFFGFLKLNLVSFAFEHQEDTLDELLHPLQNQHGNRFPLNY